ncbi:MAG TPA: hypothetical protein VGR73_03775 [Bryobacteraceae bacterium]|nr:hypothetical protein [Bryobacteraceae bacterium]
MEYYAVLAVSTFIIVALALVLYQARRDCGLLVGIGALYYWSLYGAWSLVIDKSGGFSGKYYHYLEFKMFPIALDDNYLIAIALYGAFIIVVELTLLAAVSTARVRPFPRLVLRHEPILLAGSLAAVASMLIMREKLGTAYAMNTSAYWYTRSDPGEWFTLHQVLNRVALIPPAIGAASLAAGAQSRYFVNVVRAYTWPAYVALLGSMCAFTFVLGNKNEVLSALVAGFLAYVASAERPRWIRAGLGAVAGVWFLYTIDLFRGTPLSGLWAAVTERLGEASDVGRFVASSNEAFAAHFSMYGVLAAGTPVKFGYSFYSLACSVVPRFLWPSRPRDIYLYYSESVGAIQNQGYSLHHATGWYLNFGYPGVLLGAIALGLVWAWCLNAHGRCGGRRGILVRLFAVVAPWTFAANVAPLVRAGPEGYKGLLIDGALIPVGALAFACYQKRRARRAVARPVDTAGPMLDSHARPAASRRFDTRAPQRRFPPEPRGKRAAQ